ncbi:MAG: DUF1566 domain-containing protein [Burkholderiales bacterium]
MEVTRSTKIIVGMLLSVIVGSAIAADNNQTVAKANPRYAIKGGEVYDKKSELTWQRCSVGQRWVEETGCVGFVKVFTFDDAQTLGNGTWRVPTKDELASLIDQNRVAQGQIPGIDPVAFPDMNLTRLGYWSSTPNSAMTAWGVRFGEGDIGYGYGAYRSLTYAVRLVRTGQ